MEQHFFITVHGCFQKFLYREFPFHFSASWRFIIRATFYLTFLPKFPVDWFAFRTFSNSQLSQEFSVPFVHVSKLSECFAE